MYSRELCIAKYNIWKEQADTIISATHMFVNTLLDVEDDMKMKRVYIWLNHIKQQV